MAFGLAAYVSRIGFPPTRKAGFQVLVRLSWAGFHPQGSDKRFSTHFMCVILLFQASWHNHLFFVFLFDKDRRILGVVDVELYTDELIDLDRTERHNDLFQLIGVHLAEAQQSSSVVAFRRRFPWLLANVAGGTGWCSYQASSRRNWKRLWPWLYSFRLSWHCPKA